MENTDENFSRRAFALGLSAALVAAPLVVAAQSEAEAQERQFVRQFVRPSHSPRVQRPRSHAGDASQLFPPASPRSGSLTL